MISTINTSIKQIPAIFNKYCENKDTIIINFGCGRYPDLVSEIKLKEYCVVSYDPLFDNVENNDSYVYINFNDIASIATEEVANNKNIVVYCANVLNVLNNDLLLTVSQQLKDLLKIGCSLKISIYEGSKTGENKSTKKGYQRNEKTAEYY